MVAAGGGRDAIRRLRAALPDWLAVPLRGLRHAPDRLLHPLRRRRARRAVRARRDAARILFLCLGNICRSPYAAAVLRRELSGRPDAPAVESAGLLAPGRPSPPEARRVAARRGVDLAAHRSRRIGAARAADPAPRAEEGVTGAADPVEVAAADLVLVMDARQRARARALLAAAPEGVASPGAGAAEAARPEAARPEAGRSRTEARPPTVLLLGDLDPAPIHRRTIRDPIEQPEEVFEAVYDRIDRCVRALAAELGALAAELGAEEGPS